MKYKMFRWITRINERRLSLVTAELAGRYVPRDTECVAVAEVEKIACRKVFVKSRKKRHLCLEDFRHAKIAMRYKMSRWITCMNERGLSLVTA